MLEDLSRLRSLHGATAVLWGGDSARVEEERWVALGIGRHIDFNIVLLHGRAGGQAIPQALADVAAAGVPAIVMVTAAVLADVQQLVEASWVCIGAMPLMALDLHRLPAPDEAGLPVRRLAPDEVAAAQGLVQEAFGYDREAARTALPETAADAPGRAVWGVFDDDGTLLSSAGTMVVEDVVAVWSMATAKAHRRRGHAARLLRGALAGARDEGARSCLLTASAVGVPFYRALGFTELESWQQWSRPRWVLGRV
ncbi:GNAT family N-acetyltransferase [Baekduia soli]|uniref:GNAT family N-acetyltransferase n=1 Tax=Baekduia soli TaxID=496014 RepID=UPI001652970C|nr:GNAT family N-acetyltransferase [Baekduia soli]